MSAPLPMIDPFASPRLDREATVTLMAADLVRLDAWRNKQDAVRCLLSRRDAQGRPIYLSFDVARLLDDARQAAMQSVVAKEMSAS